MGWFDSDVIEFNTDNLRGQAQNIGNLVQELRDAQNDLRKTINTLRSDWKTAAGNEFFRRFDEDWVRKLDSNIALMDELVVALKDAANEYEPLAQQYSNITLDV